MVDVPVVLVPRLEEGDHAVEQQEKEEEEDESLFATHLERNADMEFVKNFTQPDFQAKSFTS